MDQVGTLADRVSIPLPGFEGRYEATRDGEIFSILSDRVLLGFPIHNGYRGVHVKIDGERKGYRVNRLICLAYHGPPPTTEHVAAHNDGTRTNNRPENLRWATSSENQLDRYHVHGRPYPHWSWPWAKRSLDERTVYMIRELWATGCYNRRQLAERFDTNMQMISDVTTGRHYK